MITGEIKSKIDKIWEIFWTGGITNPLTVIEQFTYLLFIKGLDDADQIRRQEAELLGTPYQSLFEPDKQHLRWSHLKELDSPEEMYEIVSKEVFPFIQNLHGDRESAYSQYMKDAIFLIPTPQMLVKIVDGIDTIPMKDRDTKGDLYEYLLSKVATSGTNGQFRTPRHIVQMMVELMQPQPTDMIIDPAAGTAGFLIAAGEYLRKHHHDLFFDPKLKEHFHHHMFYGYDIDRTMLRIGAMNMLLHGVENPNITYRDSLSESNQDEEKYSLILANPPFKGTFDYESVSNDLLQITKTKKTELLFLSLFLRILKPGGRCASIVPNGVLFGSTKAHKAIRKEIIENHKLHAIISMPSGVFKPYAGVSTAIIIFTKTGTGGTDYVWFYEMKADGFSLDDKRTPIEANDIPDIIKRFHNLEAEHQRKRTEASFLVPVEEIRENDYDLSMNRYKEIDDEEIKYDPPEVILEEIEEIEKKIQSEIKELTFLLKDRS